MSDKQYVNLYLSNAQLEYLLAHVDNRLRGATLADDAILLNSLVELRSELACALFKDEA